VRLGELEDRVGAMRALVRVQGVEVSREAALA